MASSSSFRRGVRRAKRAGRVPRTLAAASAAILAAATATTASAAIAAGDWTQRQGGAAHAGSVPSGPEPPFREAWRLSQPLSGPAAQYGLSAPIVAGDLVVAVAPRAVVAADLSSGALAWSAERRFGPSVAPAAAAVEDRTLILYTEGFGARPPSDDPSASPTTSPSPGRGIDVPAAASFLTAIDGETGEPAWAEPVPLEGVSRTGVTIEGETAYVGDATGTVYAVDVATGTLDWSEPAGLPVSAPIAVAEGSVVVSVEGDRSARATLVAFDPATGERRWVHEVEGAAVFGSGPSIDGGAVFVGFSDQSIRSFDLADGSERWSSRVNALAFIAIPAVAGDAVVTVDSAGQVFRFHGSTGERIWDFALNELVVRSSAVVVGDHVLVATVDGELAAFDLETGRLVWRRGATDIVLRDLAPAGDRLVAVTGGPDAGLIAFEHDPAGSLVSEVSPTEPDVGRLAGNYLAAAVPLALLLIVGGRWLLSRLGPAFLEDEDDLGDDRGDGDGRGDGGPLEDEP